MNNKIIEQIFKFKGEANSMSELAKMCNCSRVTLTKYCKILNIEVNFKVRFKMSDKRSFLLKDILEGKYPQYPTSKLRKRLIKEGYKENKCEECGIEAVWNNKPLILHVDHIDGNNSNHKLENLRLLCPNCHSQTETFGSKNIKAKRK